MKRLLKQSVIGLLALVLLAGPAIADTLILGHGGKLDGSLQAVVFLVEGKEKTYEAAKVKGLTKAATGQDTLKLKEGEPVQGELLSLKFRTIGGILEFKRADIASLSLDAGDLNEALAELARKKGQVADDDAKGLLELAQWCREKGLGRESLVYAQASLDAMPDAATAEVAKAILNPAPKVIDDPIATEPEKPEAKLTPAEVAALKATMARNEELYREYRARVLEIRQREIEDLKHKYTAERKALVDNFNKLKRAIDAKKEMRAQRTRDWERERDNYEGAERRRWERQNPLEDRLERYDDTRWLERDEERQRNAITAVQRLDQSVQAAVRATARRANTREQRVERVYMQCRRLVSNGRNVEHHNLTTAYDAALNIDAIK